MTVICVHDPATNPPGFCRYHGAGPPQGPSTLGPRAMIGEKALVAYRSAFELALQVATRASRGIASGQEANKSVCISRSLHPRSVGHGTSEQSANIPSMSRLSNFSNMKLSFRIRKSGSTRVAQSNPSNQPCSKPSAMARIAPSFTRGWMHKYRTVDINGPKHSLYKCRAKLDTLSQRDEHDIFHFTYSGR